MHQPRLLRHRAAALALMALAGLARAGDDHHRAAPPPAVYTQECGSCHVAYPAGLLPAESWQRLMDGLPKHFGTDASTDAEATRQIAAWLAGGRRAAACAVLAWPRRPPPSPP